MAPKRKRTTTTLHHQARKRPKPDERSSCSSSHRTTASVQLQHPVLSPYYPLVLSLRTYLLGRLNAASKTRRRRIACLGHQQHQSCDGSDRRLARLLDTTLVGTTTAGPVTATPDQTDSLARDYDYFSRRCSAESSAGTGFGHGHGQHSQSDVCGLSVSLSLFSPRWLLYPATVMAMTYRAKSILTLSRSSTLPSGACSIAVVVRASSITYSAMAIDRPSHRATTPATTVPRPAFRAWCPATPIPTSAPSSPRSGPACCGCWATMAIRSCPPF